MWLDVERWASKVGSEIEPNRVGPNKALSAGDMAKTAGCFAFVKNDALFVDGGLEAFTALSELRKALEDHAVYCIPMGLLPAIISNNGQVPSTPWATECSRKLL